MDKESIQFNLPTLSLKVKKMNMKKNLRYRAGHFHNEIEVFYMVSGSVRCCFKEEEVIIGEGSCILINSRVIHQFICESPTAECTYIQVDMDEYIGHLLPGTEGYLPMLINRLRSKKYGVYKDTGELRDIVISIEEEANSQKANFQCYIKSHLYHLAAFMCRNGFAASEGEAKSAELIKIMPAIKYIEENFDKEITLNALCETINVSKYHFCRIFKKVTDITSAEYVNLYRLYRAENLLMGTSGSVSEIAFSCGFASIQYFNKMFKRYRACTPKEYRAMIYYPGSEK